MSEKITIEFDVNDAKVAHIEHLQATLSKRNARIAELEAQLSEEGESKALTRKYELGYKHGWVAASGEMMEQTRQMERYLKETHDKAFQVFLVGDRLTVAGQRVSR